MNYKVAIKMIGPDKKDPDIKDRVLKHVAACPRCREEVKKRDEHN